MKNKDLDRILKPFIDEELVLDLSTGLLSLSAKDVYKLIPALNWLMKFVFFT